MPTPSPLMSMVSSRTPHPVSRAMAPAVAAEPLVSVKMEGIRYARMSRAISLISAALAVAPSSSSMAFRMVRPLARAKY